jgi:GNAT superfamily N-acetyltransferase
MGRRQLELAPFTPDALDEAGQLLAERHRRQRLVEPGLVPRFEDPAVARAAIEALTSGEGASGAVARRDGELVGYLIGVPRPASWGANTWVEGAGHAASDPEVVRDLYGFMAAQWVEAGLTSHYALVPATDATLVDSWFRVGFGGMHTHAIREVPAADATVTVPPEMAIRPAERQDIPVLGRLEVALQEYQVRSPVFSTMPPPTLEDAVNEWEEGFDDPTFTTFVADVDGRAVGSAVGCAIEVSSEHHGIVRPDGAAFLGFAAVLPEARGLGAGRALGEAVLIWARDAGYPTVVTDWRETNLLSSRTWPRLGFRPTFRRLYRAIA